MTGDRSLRRDREGTQRRQRFDVDFIMPVHHQQNATRTHSTRCGAEPAFEEAREEQQQEWSGTKSYDVRAICSSYSMHRCRALQPESHTTASSITPDLSDKRQVYAQDVSARLAGEVVSCPSFQRVCCKDMCSVCLARFVNGPLGNELRYFKIARKCNA